MKKHHILGIACFFGMGCLQQATAQNTSPYWSLAGNSNTTTASKLGTTNGVSLRFYAGNVQRMLIGYSSGNVAIGTTTLNARLTVNAASGTHPLLGQINGTTKLFAASNGGLSVGTGSTPPANGVYSAGNLRFDKDIYSGPARLIHNTGYFNLIIGEEAGTSMSDAVDGSAGNTVVGFESQSACVNCLRNTSVGHYTLRDNTGGDNAAFGNGALAFNTTGSNNTALGSGSLQSNRAASNNTAVGSNALGLNESGADNTASGALALFNNTTGSYNIAVGVQALPNNQSGYYNVGIGRMALNGNSTNSDNTAVGDAAGYYNSLAGTFVGSLAYSSADGFTNVTAIGYNSRVTASNQVRIGNTSVTSIGGYAPWSNLSDGRFKKNMKANVPGLAFINLLKPITYTLDLEGIEKATNSNRPQLKGDPKRFEPSATETAARQQRATEIQTGFVAQEVEDAAKKINYDFSGVDKPKNGSDFYGLRYSDFVVPLVKAVQELDAENKALRSELSELRQMVLDLKNGSNTVTSASGLLEQNSPNPVSNSTTIRYQVPQAATAAHIAITNAKGQLLKTISLNNRGAGQVVFSSAALAAGTYNYTLWVDGKPADTKRFVVSR